MDSMIVFVIYLALFRLAIIAVGLVSIILGYRLFIRGIFSNTFAGSSGEGQKVSAEVAGAKFTLRNAAPGTCFALFGVIILAVMLTTGGPEVTQEMLEKGGQKTTLRGNDPEGFQSRSEQAIDYLDRGDLLQARKIVMQELNFLAKHINNYAWVLRETDPDLRQTLLLAETAVAMKPQNSQYLHTLAEIQFKTGRQQEAITTLKKAGDIDPSYRKQLRQWKSEISGN